MREQEVTLPELSKLGIKKVELSAAQEGGGLGWRATEIHGGGARLGSDLTSGFHRV